MQPKRKIKPGYANLTARIPSEKLRRMVSAESSLERDFILLLEFNEQVAEYLEQPITIPLNGGGSYTPDFLVKYSRYGGLSDIVIYEVKYRSELAKKFTQLKPKFKAAIHYCKQQGYRFKLITDKEIRTDKLKNIEFLQHVSRTVSHSEAAFRDALSRALLELKSATPNELLVFAFSSQLKRAEAIPIMWRMVADGSIKVDLNTPLTMKSQLELCPEVEERLW
ncbi:TnsA endonuclease N-terminal domain-containing protein [Pseudoalteromonas sp.]|uniref:TnsA endonuclease N-terminal domain-containing protein n=1 Tax=Pseudoalteromonas sp. TaxID=53249 RepID=UPI0026249957|nr:TnsA endonuclease N-terminal domain-containing protein [Pseudoalteromonas sp.]MCP4587015.1 heteromeric transposase endonuclease subunit TnsA [Pseudoalteromonas sp.]